MAEQKRKYQVEVLIELELDEPVDETGNTAYQAVDEIMQRAWETDTGRRWVDQKWHFSMLEDCVVDITEEESPAV